MTAPDSKTGSRSVVAGSAEDGKVVGRKGKATKLAKAGHSHGANLSSDDSDRKTAKKSSGKPSR